MISNEERREVARRLREKHEERTRPGMFEPQDMGMQAWTYLKDLESCLPDGDSAFIVLADLIEPGAERTCSMDVTDADHGLYAVLECSECGRSCEEVNGCYRYCPHCGARIG